MVAVSWRKQQESLEECFQAYLLQLRGAVLEESMKATLPHRNH